MRSKRLASGAEAWYWQPAMSDVANGYPIKSRALGSVFSSACQTAEALTADLLHWRASFKGAVYEHGTLSWAVSEFQASRQFRDVSKGTQRDYSRLLNSICALPLKNGKAVGTKPLEAIDARFADGIHDRLSKSGLRQANYAMAAIRRMWNVTHRLHPKVVPSTNPFEGMGIKSEARETVPATWNELRSFTSKAIAMGEPGIALGAELCWDLWMRPQYVFAAWSHEHWKPKDRPHQALVISEKNDNDAWAYVCSPDEDEADFYPELSALMRLAPTSTGLACARSVQRGGRKYHAFGPIKNYAAITRRVREAAGLPTHITMASFRHGGLTELGEGGLSDALVQALSRHKTRQTLTRYMHSTDDVVKAAARARFESRKAK
jgi:integrase